LEHAEVTSFQKKLEAQAVHYFEPVQLRQFGEQVTQTRFKVSP